MQRDPAIDSEGRKDISQAIADLTDRGIAERVIQQKGFVVLADTEQQGTSVVSAPQRQTQPPRQAVQVLPPIQIKGLAADVMTVKRGFMDIREVVRDVNLVSAALKQDLADVKAQLESHRQDIRFEAEALGNGGEG